MKMGKSGKKNTAQCQGPKKLNPQKTHELKLLLQKLLLIDIDKKCNVQQLWTEFVELRAVVDRIQAIESDLKVKTVSSDRMKNIQTFYKWVKDNGGKFDGLEIAEFPGFELGLKATKDVAKGEPIITMPKKLFMSLDNPVVLSEPYLSEIPFPPTINVKLAFWLIVEKLNPASFWKPYIDMLPDKYPTFLSYSVQDMQELKGSGALSYAINQFKKYIRMYGVTHSFLCGQSTHPTLEAARNNFTFDLFAWGISTVLTRENLILVQFPETLKYKNFEITKEPIMCPALIPFWDMANHRNGEVTTFMHTDIDSMVCSAMEDFKKGEQIFIMYGKRTNAEALMHNGFLYKDNPNDLVWIKLGLNDTDELLSYKRDLLQKLNISISTELHLLPGPTFISPELLGFVRVFNMNKEQLEHWLTSDKAMDLLHLDCALDTSLEIKTWTFLKIRLTLLLKSFPTTIDEDEALLAGPKQLSHIKTHLIGLRLQEKKILKSALEYVELQLLPSPKNL